MSRLRDPLWNMAEPLQGLTLGSPMKMSEFLLFPSPCIPLDDRVCMCVMACRVEILNKIHPHPLGMLVGTGVCALPLSGIVTSPPVLLPPPVLQLATQTYFGNNYTLYTARTDMYIYFGAVIEDGPPVSPCPNWWRRDSLEYRFYKEARGTYQHNGPARDGFFIMSVQRSGASVLLDDAPPLSLSLSLPPSPSLHPLSFLVFNG